SARGCAVSHRAAGSSSEPRTQRSGVSGAPDRLLRCAARGSDTADRCLSGPLAGTTIAIPRTAPRLTPGPNIPKERQSLTGAPAQEAAPAGRPAGPAAAHALSAAEVFALYNSDPERGLSGSQVQSLRERHGFNELAEMPPPPLWRKFLGQFSDLVIWILLAA